jgi:hypothetical protein
LTSNSPNVLDIPFPNFVLEEILMSIDPVIAFDPLPTINNKSNLPENPTQSEQFEKVPDSDSQPVDPNTESSLKEEESNEGNAPNDDILLTALSIEAALSNIHFTLVNASVTQASNCKEMRANGTLFTKPEVTVVSETTVEHTIEQKLTEENIQTVIAKAQAEAAANVTETTHQPSNTTDQDTSIETTIGNYCYFHF